MKTIFIITALCIILKKSGAVGAFLDRLETEPTAAIPDTEPTAARPDHITEREKLEKQAHYILTMQKYEYPETVFYMSETMLIQIINNYCKP